MNQLKQFPSWPHYDLDEIETVETVLKSGRVNYWTGEQVKKFEAEFAEYCGCDYAIALANGTLSLELALYAIGIKQGDDVLVPSRTFIATASSVVRSGANPVFADVDKCSQNISVDKIKEVITEKTKAIIVVHLAGFPCDMDSIMKFATENHLHVIEDCAQAHGACYKGKVIGSFGEFGSFSFCQDKIMSTGGEGGMLITNNKSLWEKAWSFKDHGKDYYLMQESSENPGYKWVHNNIGSNYRMTEMQAAIGRIQLKKLDNWLEKRAENASIFQGYFSNIPCLQVLTIPEYIKHAYYKYYVYLDLEKINMDWSRDKILEELHCRGIPVAAGSCSEVYLENAFKPYKCMPSNRHVNAKRLGEVSLMFQVHPTLLTEHVEYMAKSTIKVMELAMK